MPTIKRTSSQLPTPIKSKKKGVRIGVVGQCESWIIN